MDVVSSQIPQSDIEDDFKEIMEDDIKHGMMPFDIRDKSPV